MVLNLADQLTKTGYQPVGVSRMNVARACPTPGVQMLDEMVGMDISGINIAEPAKRALHAYRYILIVFIVRLHMCCKYCVVTCIYAGYS